MTIKRVNFTERKKVNKKDITIEISDGSPRTFHARLNLQEYKFPPKAEVFLEATCTRSEIVQRFHFGQIKHIVPTRPLVLDKLTDENKNIRFTLKIVDTSQEIGRMLGIAKNIHPINATKGMPLGSLLPIVRNNDLEDQLWRLHFNEDAEVFLHVNGGIDGLKEDFESENSRILCLILPAIVREILYRAFRDGVEEEDDQGGWKTDWIRLAKDFNLDPLPKKDDDDVAAWIEEAVTGFCKHHRFKKLYSENTGETP
jgi:hypothetical protein